MVETGASNGEMEDIPVLTGNEMQTDGLISKDANSKTEMVRLIIQSLQHLGYGYVVRVFVRVRVLLACVLLLVRHWMKYVKC
jgi:hypothetical protein